MKSLASKPKEPPSCSTFQVKARLYVNFIAIRKYNFLDSLFLLFCAQNLCCNDSETWSFLKLDKCWKDVSVTNVDIFAKKQFSLQFVFSLPQVYIVYRVFFYFSPKCLLVSVCIKGFAYLLCWPRGSGIGLLVCTRRPFVSWILQIFTI